MKLPHFDSIEQLAEFCDSHDVTDFEEDFEEVGEPVFERQTFVKVPLDAKQIETAEQIAAEKGVTVPILIQQWVSDRVQNQ